jgi:hypothetical protein
MYQHEFLLLARSLSDCVIQAGSGFRRRTNMWWLLLNCNLRELNYLLFKKGSAAFCLVLEFKKIKHT